MARPRSGRARVGAALALSLALNLLFLTRIDLSWLDHTSAPQPVSLASLGARDWEANRRVGPRAAVPVPVPQLQVQDPSEPKGQVVHAARPAEPPKEAPRDARFLAEFNSKVEKETRSRRVGLGAGAQSAPPASPPQGMAGKPDAKPDGADGKREEPRKLAFNFKPLGEVRRSAAAPAPEAGPEASAGSSAPRGIPGADGAERKLDLRPGAAVYQALAGGGSPDKIDGVEDGDANFLNTREWKYAGFFNRIGNEIYPVWVREAQAAVDARDPTRQRYLYKDRLTVVDIRLDAQGKLLDIHVRSSSGATFLDEAVLKAWKEVQPFSNVPRGLANERGEIAFSWGFNVYGVSGSPVQLFLGPNRY